MLLKNVVKTALYACVAGAVLFGCGTATGSGGLNDEPEDNFDGLIRTGENVTRRQGSVPAGDADLLADVLMNDVLISGGSTTITVKANEELRVLYISVGNEPGYYEVNLRGAFSMDGVLYVYTPTVYISQKSSSLETGGPLPISLVGVSTGRATSKPKDKSVTTKVVGAGALQLALSWNSPSDVDLHVTLPPITAGGNRPHVYYGDDILLGEGDDTLAYLDMDANASCRNDVRNENMFFNKLLDGHYLVYLDFYGACSGSSESTTDFTVSATAGGRLLSGGSHLLSYSGNFASEKTKILGVITVQSGKVVKTDYSASDVIALMSSSPPLKKRPAPDKNFVAVK